MKTQPNLPHLRKNLFAQGRAVLTGVTLALAPLAAQPAPASAPTQLLPNGDMEAATSEANWPDHWSRPTAGSCSWDQDEGKRYLRMNVTEPGQVVLTYRSIALPPEVKAVQVSLRARVIGLKCGAQSWFDARIMADFKTKDGQKLKGAKAIVFRKDTEGWVERSVRYAVPEGASVLEIMPTLFQAYSGTFDIDEIIITPIDPAEVATAP